MFLATISKFVQEPFYKERGRRFMRANAYGSIFGSLSFGVSSWIYDPSMYPILSMPFLAGLVILFLWPIGTVVHLPFFVAKHWLPLSPGIWLVLYLLVGTVTSNWYALEVLGPLEVEWPYTIVGTVAGLTMWCVLQISEQSES